MGLGLMKDLLRALLVLLFGAAATTALAECENGAYADEYGDRLVVVPNALVPEPMRLFLFEDGRFGALDAPGSNVNCEGSHLNVQGPQGDARPYKLLNIVERETSFTSVGTALWGKLIEPAKIDATRRPLVVMVHGSERYSPKFSPYAYMLAARGMSVFVFDKRGTGQSEGEYTQNFPLLAEDAASALRHARLLADGNFLKSGFFGRSQAGWVAPLAAKRANADFVAVGFGMIASPIEEDHQEMLAQALRFGASEEQLKLIENVSEMTARLVLSDFRHGFEGYAEKRQEWLASGLAGRVTGEYSGAILSLDEATLRRIGEARFDAVELVWGYDALAIIKDLNVPLLWVLAEQDREAPSARTLEILRALKRSGNSIDAYMFPDTDHGMVEFVESEDGTRQMTRITSGYLRLVSDWILGVENRPYGGGNYIE